MKHHLTLLLTSFMALGGSPAPRSCWDSPLSNHTWSLPAPASLSEPAPASQSSRYSRPLLPSHLSKSSSSWDPPAQCRIICLVPLLQEALPIFSLLQALLSCCQDPPTSPMPCPGCDTPSAALPHSVGHPTHPAQSRCLSHAQPVGISLHLPSLSSGSVHV